MANQPFTKIIRSKSLICILRETFEVKFCGKKIYDEDFEIGNNNKKILS